MGRIALIDKILEVIIIKYKISSLAKLLGVSSNTIRRYTDMGYIHPVKDGQNNYTYYDNIDVNKIIRVRMYRKFGFSHDEIKKILEEDVDGILENFKQRLLDMDEELEKMKSLRRMFKANEIMIKRIDEYDENFIIQNVEATYYIEYQKGDELFNEKDRISAIQEFMYSLPETKEVFIFRKNDILNGNYTNSFGFAAKKKDLEKFNVRVNHYMDFLDVQSCLYFLIKTYLYGDDVDKKNERLRKAKFDEAFEYLEKENLAIDKDIIGFNITSAVERGEQVNYTLVCMPVVSNLKK